MNRRASRASLFARRAVRTVMRRDQVIRLARGVVSRSFIAATRCSDFDPDGPPSLRASRGGRASDRR